MIHVLSFALGVAASLLATYLAHLIVQWKRRGLARQLEGSWAETILGSERPVSICRLTYKPRTRDYVYSGTNYFPSGDDYCDFESESVTFDWKARRMFYIYRFWKKGQIGSQTYGYGWISIEEEGGSVWFADGHYRSSEPDSEAQHSRMERLEDACAVVKIERGGFGDAAWKAKFAKKYAAKKQRS